MAWPVFLLLLHLHLGQAWDCPTGENCTAGLFITGGTVGRWVTIPVPLPIPTWNQIPQSSIEMFPATLCPVNSIPSFPGYYGFGGGVGGGFGGRGGLHGHSLSAVDNGRKLVACGGRDSKKSGWLFSAGRVRTVCISWRSGQDEWTREFNIIQGRYDHASVVMPGDVIIVIGGNGQNDVKDTANVLPPNIEGDDCLAQCRDQDLDPQGAHYNGCVSTTVSGRTCQAWASTTPHKHKWTSLEKNYCRNPDKEPRPWCYTTDSKKRWEFCETPICAAAANAYSLALQNSGWGACALVYNEHEFITIGGWNSTYGFHGKVDRYSNTGGKGTDGGWGHEFKFSYLSSLPDLATPRWNHGCSSFLTTSGELALLVTGGSNWAGRGTVIGDYLASTELFFPGMSTWKIWGKLPRKLTGLTSLVANINQMIVLVGGIDSSDKDRDEVLQFVDKTKTWHLVGKQKKARKDHAIAAANVPPVCAEPVDCGVSAWSAWGNCIVHSIARCGLTGRKTRSRKVVREAEHGGAACPDLEETVACKTEPCPVVKPADCKVSEWSWKDEGKCSVSCGYGTTTRTRKVIKEAEPGGAACPSLEHTTPCKGEKCPVDCRVRKWGAWGDCSSKTNTRKRVRSVIIPARHGGAACPDLREEEQCAGVRDEGATTSRATTTTGLNPLLALLICLVQVCCRRQTRN